MRYLGMALAFAAVGFVAANIVFSLLAAALWRVVRAARPGGDSIFLIRMLPASGSALVVMGLVLPAFWSFEPRATSETVGPVLALFVVLAGVLLASGLRRALLSWVDTRRLERRWKSAAVGGASLELPVRAYRVPCEMPLAALVGVVRPRLFVSEAFMSALSDGERRAVIAHEAGHLRSLDNFKRTLMRLAPDALSFSPTGRELEQAWAVAAEEAADDHAAGPDRSRSLDLASALLKASRRAPVRFAEVSSFCEESTIARRIARLLRDDPPAGKPSRSLAPRIAWVLVLLTGAALVLGPSLRAAYTLTEAAIRLLQ
jgi:beta-lactamase regulating signal transducer with metallopeptidase domain